MKLTAGTRLRAAVGHAEFVVVKAPGEEVDLRCGGHPVVELGDAQPAGLAVDPGHAGGVLIGKRYSDPESGLELLCTKGGDGGLSLGDVSLSLKDAKPLPSSD